MKFWASFPRIYGIQQAKQIRKLTIQIGYGLLESENLKKNLLIDFM